MSFVGADRVRGMAVAYFLIAATVACEPTPDGVPLLPPQGPASGTTQNAIATGPLTTLASNPRYFTDADGRRAVYLTGSHTWNNFQDWGVTDPPPAFDYSAYLDLLVQHGHNFIRLYVWEQAAWFPAEEKKVVIAPLPYLRTGPGRALDGKPKFDLTQFDPAYFNRLRERVEAAATRGIYVSLMLFDGWSIELKGRSIGNPFQGHPFNRENNINGIDGDLDGDGEGKELHTLNNPAVTALQKAYLRKVVETVGDLDNVLWEISNESGPGAGEWQYDMISTIKEIESATGRQHPAGMTALYPPPDYGNALLFESPADWIAPHAEPIDHAYKDDPPASTGKKVVVLDTDHLWGVGGNPRWVWKSFFRGYNPIFMDPYVTTIRRLLPAWPSSVDDQGILPSSPAPEWADVRRAMGYARAVADRVDLASMRPTGNLASTGYCLAAPGREYLIYVPFHFGSFVGSILPHREKIESTVAPFFGSMLPEFARENVEVDLSGAQDGLDVEWVDVERGMVIPGSPVTGGGRLQFHVPFGGDAVLHLRAREAEAAG